MDQFARNKNNNAKVILFLFIEKLQILLISKLRNFCIFYFHFLSNDPFIVKLLPKLLRKSSDISV